ncbi:MAG: hypothetical protein ACKPKO_15570, partial [Candidatus Fonsibacter sp.]
RRQEHQALLRSVPALLRLGKLAMRGSSTRSITDMAAHACLVPFHNININYIIIIISLSILSIAIIPISIISISIISTSILFSDCLEFEGTFKLY